MTSTTAQHAYGSQLQRETSPGNGIFATIANVTNIQPSGPKRKFVDTSQLSGGGWDEQTPVLNSGGTVSADIDFNTSDPLHLQLRQDQLSGTKSNYREVYPDTTYTAFAAFVESLPVDAKVSDVLKGKLVLQLTGPVTGTV